jgi:hypothetical protein
MEAAIRIPLKESLYYLHKLLENYNEETKRIFTGVYEQLLTRTGTKFTETNAKMLFEFLQRATPATPKETSSPANYSPAIKEVASPNYTNPPSFPSPEYTTSSPMEVEEEELHNGNTHTEENSSNSTNKDNL